MRFPSLALAILAAASTAHSPPAPADELDSQWSAWGASPGGTRYAPARQLTPENVADLEVAWRYSTGEMSRRSESMLVNSSAETTPILAADSLVTCTPFGRVIALDPATGKERWTFDPEIDPDFELPNQYVCRGVAQWQDRQAPGDERCDHRPSL